jgi:hypothetical protein
VTKMTWPDLNRVLRAVCAPPPEVPLSGEPKHCPLIRTQYTETPQVREYFHLRRCWLLVAFASNIVGKRDSRNAFSCPLR